VTAGAKHPPDARLEGEAPDTERLHVARGVLADIAHHTPQDVQAACRVVLECSDDDQEREDAQGLLTFFAERRGGTPCARS
jgi:hypothetical protein